MLHWMEWVVVMRNMPLAEVDNKITCKGVRYGAITSKLLRKTIFLLQSEVKTKIKEQLPNQLVLVFDGWTEGNEHFIGIHESKIDPISNLAIETLLSMQPLVLAEGVKTMTSADRVCHITKTLTHYGKTVDNIVCLAGDNCPVNQSMARILGVPLMGCGLHKFNLAIKNWVMEQPSLLRIIMNLSILMKKAGTLKTLQL